MKINISIFILLIFQIKYSYHSEINDKYNNYSDDDDCQYNIHRKCRYEQSYTEEEVDNVRKYLIKRFAVTNPVGKPCETLHVRKDIKCLTKDELEDLFDVLNQLFQEGVIDKFTFIHNKYYVATHKFSEAFVWHRWFIMMFEKEMMKRNSKVTLPYWEFPLDFNEPEKSYIWKLFGHSGNPDNDDCVEDNPFKEYILNVTKPHCLRRRWNEEGKMEVWESPEWQTAASQLGVIPWILNVLIYPAFQSSANSPNALQELLEFTITQLSQCDCPNQLWPSFSLFMGRVGHFKTHISIGGYKGDMSIKVAPNDITFYFFHAFLVMTLFRWQLQNDRNLVPKSYNFGLRYDLELQKPFPTNIDKDTLTYFNATVKEAYQIGYGELCYIEEQFITPINKLMENMRPNLPLAVKRLKKVLPPEKFKLYFPKFANKQWTYFDYYLPHVGNCNPRDSEGFCEKMNVAKRFNETAAGLDLLDFFRNGGGVDATLSTYAGEDFYYEFIQDLERYNYCSPYV